MEIPVLDIIQLRLSLFHRAMFDWPSSNQDLLYIRLIPFAR